MFLYLAWKCLIRNELIETHTICLKNYAQKEKEKGQKRPKNKSEKIKFFHLF